MCDKSLHSKKFKLSDFFMKHWDSYVKHPTEFIEPEQFRAVNAILSCRTPKLGTDLYKCPDCDKEHFVYHSCKHRFCPTCGYLDTLAWSDSILRKMIDKPHHHAVIMLPSSFRQLAKDNREMMYGILMRSAAESFLDWFAAKWSIKPGIMCVLHTFGEDKKYHVHVHLLITAGGLHLKTGKYVELDTKSWFVDYSWFCNQKFRPILLAEIRRNLKNGKLKHNYGSRKEWETLLTKEDGKKWRMHIEEPLSNTEHIVKYVGRYTKRACLSEYKITNIEGEYISFKCKDYRNSTDKKNPKEIIVTYHYSEFFPRLLQHVPTKNFRTVRYYGVYHQMDKNVPHYLRKREQELERIKATELSELTTYVSPLNCPDCQTKMTYVQTLIDKRKRSKENNRRVIAPDKYDGLEVFTRDFRKRKNEFV